MTYSLPDGPVDVAQLPGVPEPGPGQVALCDAARHVSAKHIFVAGPAATTTALWAARAGATVTYWTENAAEGQVLEASFRRNALPGPHSFVQADFAGMERASCEVALIHLPRGKALQDELLRLAAAMLVPAGRLIFVGATNEGVKGARQLVQSLFGQAGIVARKGGYHAGLAQRPAGDFPFPAIHRTVRDVTVAGVPTRVVSYSGAFAAERLDDGAAALIAGMKIASGAQVLDLGCGTGLVGLAALRQGVQVVLTDVSARAVISARETLAANGYPDVPVVHTCGAAGIPAATFDTVVTNPPFHQGHGIHFAVARLFIQEAARILKADGTLYLVANAFLNYAPWLQERFRDVRLVWQDKRFHVWGGRK